MTIVEKLLFEALSIDRANYLSWYLDIEAHLSSRNLQDTITTDVGCILQEKAEALILIRHHLAAPLKKKYMNQYNPRILSDDLQSCDYMKTISLPTARHDWINLRVQDHTSIANHKSELFRITSQLAVYGHLEPNKEQIEKTLSTFHAANLVLSSQYRNMHFTKYSNSS